MCPLPSGAVWCGTPQATHWLMWDQPEDVTRCLLEFLEPIRGQLTAKGQDSDRIQDATEGGDALGERNAAEGDANPSHRGGSRPAIPNGNSRL